MRTIPRDQVVALVLVVPAFLYLGGKLVTGYQGWDSSSALGFVIIPLLLLIGLFPIYGQLVELLGFIAVGVVAILGTTFNAFGGGGFDFAAGILLASPFLLGVWAWAPGRSAPARLIGLGIALLESLILLAALASIVTNGSAETSTNLFSWYTEVNIQQLCGLAGLLSLAPSGCPSPALFPLRDIVDPVFVFLAGIAFLGSLMPVLTPRTARGEEGDAESWDEFDESSRVPADLPITPEMMRGLSLRTPPRASPGLLPPGGAALLAASFLTLVFLGAAISDATEILLPTVLAVLVGLGVVLAVDRPGAKAARGLPAPPATRTPAPAGAPAASPSEPASPAVLLPSAAAGGSAATVLP